MFSEKQQSFFGWVPKTLHTVSQWGFLKTKNSAGQKRLFGKKIETWYVGLSSQYTHSMSFSSKSEHDTVADQAITKGKNWRETNIHGS